MGTEDPTLTRLLAEGGSGETGARDLLPLVYGELRKLAAAHFVDERCDHTLQPTALANEAYLRLAEDPIIRVSDRAHFFRLASKIMRQILVDHARSRDSLKRGGGNERFSISDAIPGGSSGSEIDLLALDDALRRLATLNERKARLVELRFFGGLSIEDAADVLGISRTQATREWRTARAWLADELQGEAQS